MNAETRARYRARCHGWFVGVPAVVFFSGLGIACLSAGCAKPPAVVESGALLMRIILPAGPSAAAAPDELRVWIYDDGGVVFRSARIPGAGTLPPPESDQELGTILVQPGVTRGDLRIHVRAFLGGLRTLDGVARVTSPWNGRSPVDVVLGSTIPADVDNDDVPDVIDDCPAELDPDQTGCPSTKMSDAAVDGSPDASPSSDAGRDIGRDGGNASDAADATDAARVNDGGMDRGGSGGGGNTGGGGVGGSVSRSGGASGTDAGAVDAKSTDARVDGPQDGASVEVPPKKEIGVACDGPAACGSGFCTDGVCCKVACDQPCQTCGTGQCLSVTKATDVPQCSGSMTCNANAKCVAG